MDAPECFVSPNVIKEHVKLFLGESVPTGGIECWMGRAELAYQQAHGAAYNCLHWLRRGLIERPQGQVGRYPHLIALSQVPHPATRVHLPTILDIALLQRWVLSVQPDIELLSQARDWVDNSWNGLERPKIVARSIGEPDPVPCQCREVGETLPIQPPDRNQHVIG